MAVKKSKFSETQVGQPGRKRRSNVDALDWRLPDSDAQSGQSSRFQKSDYTPRIGSMPRGRPFCQMSVLDALTRSM